MYASNNSIIIFPLFCIINLCSIYYFKNLLKIAVEKRNMFPEKGKNENFQVKKVQIIRALFLAKLLFNHVALYGTMVKTCCGKCNTKGDSNKDRQELKEATPPKERRRVPKSSNCSSGASCLRKLAILIFRQSETNLLIKSKVRSRAAREILFVRVAKRNG